MLLRTGLALAGLLAVAQSATAEVYCKTVGVPKGCVMRPGHDAGAPGVGVAPGVDAGAPGVGVAPGPGTAAGPDTGSCARIAAARPIAPVCARRFNALLRR